MVPDQRGGTDFSRTSWKTPAETWPQTAQLQQFWLDHAVNGLRRSNPESSASSPLARWQRQGLAVTAVLIPILFFLSAHFTWLALQALFALPFFLIVLVRLLAIWELAWHSPASFEAGPPLAVPQSLPAYSVLVALYDETAVADVLVRALAALDYPQDKLEILFVTEADDHATRDALESSGMADNMHIIIVPKGAPQTKPRALNYALSFSSGELIAVFDAEDIPESNQLRRAVHAFEAGGSDLACVQAHLNIYNAGKNAITRGIMAQTPLEVNPFVP